MTDWILVALAVGALLVGFWLWAIVSVGGRYDR